MHVQERKRLPLDRTEVGRKFQVGDHEGYIHVGLYDDGSPGDIFVDIAKDGTTMAGLMNSLCLAVSMGLQYGVPPEVYVSKLSHMRFEPSGLTNDADIRTAKSIVDQLDGTKYIVQSVGTREKKRNPVAPFITSTLQQEAARKLRFSVKRTMMIAQRLYEGVELGEEGLVGLITYMRTDSTRVSKEALAEVREMVGKEYGPQYLPEQPNTFKSKKGAQEAHEAIRPTTVAHTPDSVKQYLKEDEFKVYKLI